MMRRAAIVNPKFVGGVSVACLGCGEVFVVSFLDGMRAARHRLSVECPDCGARFSVDVMPSIRVYIRYVEPRNGDATKVIRLVRPSR